MQKKKQTDKQRRTADKDVRFQDDGKTTAGSTRMGVQRSLHPSIYPFVYSSTCLPLYTLDFLLECVLYNVICDVLSSEVLWDVTLANDTNDLGGFLFFAFSSLSVCSRKMDPSTTTTKQEPARKQQEQHRKHNATREPRGTKGRKGWLVPRTFSFGEPLAVNRRRQGSKIQERLTQRSEYITV